MTVTFFESIKPCVEWRNEINKTLFKNKPVVKCMLVEIVDAKGIGRCGIRPAPRDKKLKAGSSGFIVGRSINEFEDCGLKRMKKERD